MVCQRKLTRIVIADKLWGPEKKMNIVGIYHFCFSGKSDNGHYEVHIAKNGPADRWNPKVCLTREDRCLQSSFARRFCTAYCTLEQTNIFWLSHFGFFIFRGLQ